MLFDRLRLMLILLLVPHLAVCSPATSTPQMQQEQKQDFTAKLVALTLSDISEEGPSRETASFVARSMDLLWSSRRELFEVTAPHLDAPDPSRTRAAMDILYRLRSYRPLSGFGFDEEAWRRDNGGFFAEVDASVFRRLPRLLASRDDDLVRNLALYLGSAAASAESKRALLELAKRPGVGEQALICLTWHKDRRDMDDLLPFVLGGGSEASGLPYHFRNSYGAAAVPYLRQALERARSPFVRLGAARELVHTGERAGVRYMYEAVLRRGELPNGEAQAEEIRQFAWDHMGFPKQATAMDDLVRFLKGKL